MADDTLKQVTQLGSTLAKTATEQLDKVLVELRGPLGSTPHVDSASFNMGTLAVSLLQVVNRVGSIMTELSQFDLVKRPPALVLNAPNAPTSITLPHGTDASYSFLVENSGNVGGDVLAVTLTFQLYDRNGAEVPGISDTKSEELSAGERRRVEVKLPYLAAGAYTLRIAAVQDSTGATVSTKIVTITVLAPPQQHSPSQQKSE